MSYDKRTLNRNVRNNKVAFLGAEEKHLKDNYLTSSTACVNSKVASHQNLRDDRLTAYSSIDTINTLDYLDELNLSDLKSNESSNNGSIVSWIDELNINKFSENQAETSTLLASEQIDIQLKEIDNYFKGKGPINHHCNENHYSNQKEILDEWKNFFPDISILGRRSLTPSTESSSDGDEEEEEKKTDIFDRNRLQSASVLHIEKKHEFLLGKCKQTESSLPPIVINHRAATASIVNNRQKFGKSNENPPTKLPPIFHRDWR